MVAQNEYNIKSLSTDQQNLLQYLTFAVTPIDSIIARSQLNAAQVTTMLLELELLGFVHAVSGGYQLSHK